ncbi:MAG: 16S rRNA (cytidine(1402)-2'-O)-methyltransferase [Verrucomicrobiota bacterium]|nr:16S rRNA (cytidine(1402)-2'-O)-methyltransferase [Verrucomicrobiota bacterium]
MTGKLSIVATPIGNLEDITLRALRILKEADVVACEDTRHSGNLLRHFEISKKLVSYHEFNEAKRTAELTGQIAQGTNVALISDAGTPGISDPGARIIRAVIAAGLPLEVIPGASAIISALVGSGLSTDEFYFGGFLPVKSAQRQNVFRKLLGRSETICFYESPHRIASCLDDLESVFPDRQIVLARELTKIHEQFARGTPAEVKAQFVGRSLKGEMVILVSGLDAKPLSVPPISV